MKEKIIINDKLKSKYLSLDEKRYLFKELTLNFEKENEEKLSLLDNYIFSLFEKYFIPDDLKNKNLNRLCYKNLTGTNIYFSKLSQFDRTLGDICSYLKKPYIDDIVNNSKDKKVIDRAKNGDKMLIECIDETFSIINKSFYLFNAEGAIGDRIIVYLKDKNKNPFPVVDKKLYNMTGDDYIAALFEKMNSEEIKTTIDLISQKINTILEFSSKIINLCKIPIEPGMYYRDITYIFLNGVNTWGQLYNNYYEIFEIAYDNIKLSDEYYKIDNNKSTDDPIEIIKYKISEIKSILKL